MRILCLSLCLLAAGAVFAQGHGEPIDREVVRKLVADSSAGTYYPRLLARYATFDTTLTIGEYRLLYYGFVFQKAYNPYGDDHKRVILGAMQEKRYAVAIASCDTVLASVPVSLVANYYRGLAMYLLGKDNPAAMDSGFVGYRNRFVKLQTAILSTGDGLSCKTAFKTIFVADEYEIISRYFELDRPSAQALVYPCDKLDVSPNAYFKASAIYFDTSESFNAMKDKIK